MDEYIKREDARLARPEWLELVDDFSAGFNVCIDEYIDKIDEIPAADVQEVRHGHWIRREGFDYENNVVLGVCSKCNWKVKNFTNYCPNCGVKMDEEAEDEGNV